MTLSYSSINRIVSRKERVATTKHLCGVPTGLCVATTKTSSATIANRRALFGFDHTLGADGRSFNGITSFSGITSRVPPSANTTKSANSYSINRNPPRDVSNLDSSYAAIWRMAPHASTRASRKKMRDGDPSR